MPLLDLTIHEAHNLLKTRQISSFELTEAVLRRIEEVEPRIKAFITLTPEIALAQAKEADARIAAGEARPLTGVPAGIKDILCTKEVRTTAGSRMLENFRPPFEATVMTKLKNEGLVMVGKLNQDEFAMGSSTENSAFFPTRNPWDTNRVPGGSSGGSAAAVPAGEAFYTLGTDTGGSIRQPAALCNVTGMKPTYGRVSRFGLIAFASSLDQIGPFTKDVEDCAIVLNAIAGHDPLDSTSQDVPVPDYTRALVDDIHGLKLGIPREYFIEGIQPGVKDAVQAAITKLSELGAQVEEVSLPHTKYALPTYYIIAPAEASANLARYDGVKYGYSAPDAESMWDGYFKTRERAFGTEVKRRIMLGTYALSAGYYDAYYLKAQKVRTLIKHDFDRALERVDALVAPVSPTTAFELGARIDDPLQMYLSDVLTIPVNMAGIAAMSVPCGFADGLPVGLQIIAKPFEEETLLRVGYAYQQHTDWHRRKPEL